MDDEKVLEGLKEQIEICYEDLRQYTADSDEYQNISKNLDNLLNRWNSIITSQNDAWAKAEELEIRKNEAELSKLSEKRSNWKDIADIAVKGVTLMIFTAELILTLKFEETGSIRSKGWNLFVKPKL